MAQEKYAYAIASTRIKENALLTADDMEQLLSIGSYQAICQQLIDRGWLASMPISEQQMNLQDQLVSTWNFLMEIAPQPELFHQLILKNDFHNLKAAVKCAVGGISPQPYFIQPSVYDAQTLSDAVVHRRFEELPESMRGAAQQAYEVLVRTQDGQFADVYIDTAALNAIREAGRKTKNALLNSLSELICAASNIKTTVRAVQTQKDAYFLDSALCVCDTLDKSTLSAAALKGREALDAYLMTTDYAGAVKSVAESQSAFEKWFDDLILDRLSSAKYIFFGPEPMVAYYIARETEVKNIRILLSGKRNAVDDKIIRERMRRLYV